MVSFDQEERVKVFMLRNPLIVTVCAGIMGVLLVTIVFAMISWIMLGDTTGVLVEVISLAFFVFVWCVSFSIMRYRFHLTAWHPVYFSNRFKIYAIEKYQYIFVGIVQLITVLFGAALAIYTDDTSSCVSGASLCDGNVAVWLYSIATILALVILLDYLYALIKILMSQDS